MKNFLVAVSIILVAYLFGGSDPEAIMFMAGFFGGDKFAKIEAARAHLDAIWDLQQHVDLAGVMVQSTRPPSAHRIAHATSCMV